MRASGLADTVTHQELEGPQERGICRGHQMLGRTITDDVESRAGTVPGLGLLPADVRFGREKVLSLPVGEAFGEPVRGYEIHHGVVTYDGGAEPFLDGGRVGAV